MRRLRFACQPGCTACCDQQGFVYLTEADIKRAAKYVGMPARKFEERYIYRTAHLRRLRKPPDKQCPFLLEDRCSIHPAKPTQCRTFPFWPENVETVEGWNDLKHFCPGVGKGELIQIGDALERSEEHRRAYPEMYE